MNDPRAQRWQRYLADLEAYAAIPQPLASAGSLVRVTGLVLEAAGIRAPVGAVCEVHGESGPPVQAEVVGFDGDRAFLMPTGEVHGLASGARVLPRPAPSTAPRLGAENHPWRRSEDRGLHLPVGDGLLGRVVDPHGQPMDRCGPIENTRSAPMIRCCGCGASWRPRAGCSAGSPDSFSLRAGWASRAQSCCASSTW